jgi:hypothetical protein
MAGLRGSAHHTLTTPVRLTMRQITLALAAVLATRSGDDQPGATKSVRVTPSAPTAVKAEAIIWKRLGSGKPQQKAADRGESIAPGRS